MRDRISDDSNPDGAFLAREDIIEGMGQPDRQTERLRQLFERAGHFPHCEAPEAFVQRLLDFMREAPPAQHSDAQLREFLGPRSA